MTNSYVEGYGTRYPSASGVKIGGVGSVLSNCDISKGYSAAVSVGATGDSAAGLVISYNRLHNVRPQGVEDGVSDSVCGVYCSTFGATQQMYFHHNHIFNVHSLSGNGPLPIYLSLNQSVCVCVSMLVN